MTESMAPEVDVRLADERNGSGAPCRREPAWVPEGWRTLLDAVPAAVLIVAPDGTISFANTELERITGYRREVLHGRPVEVLVPEDLREIHGVARSAYEAEPESRPMGTGRGIACRRADGTAFPADISLSPLVVGDEMFVIATVSDETERRRSADEMFHRAVHDPLTGLANRVLVVDRLTLALARVDRQARLLGVLYVDLDGFKAVNDTWGHAIGDEVLRTVADRLIATVRPQDTVARFGGDEFVVLCEDLAAPADALLVAERMLRALSRPIRHRAGIGCISASIGVVLTAGEAEATDLIKAADRAMYRAKRRGGAAVEMIGDERGRTEAL